MTKQLTLLATTDEQLEAPSEARANRGEVFTRPWVVEFILNLVGYVPEEDLGSKVIVEPACGSGAFLLSIVDRLVISARRHDRNLASAVNAIRAFDVQELNVDLTRKAVVHRLGELDVPNDLAERLVIGWVTTADFLLLEHEVAPVDFVVGNPPYIRLEDVPPRLTDAYKRAHPTMRGRSDIYVGFLEMGLRLLRTDGQLGFICADRWMHNQYGGALRELVTSSFAVDTIVSMHDVDAFEEDVSAYPAIVVIRSGEQDAVNVVETTAEFGPEDSKAVTAWLRERTPYVSRNAVAGARLDKWFSGEPSWPAGNPARQALVAHLESSFEPLETPETGTRVGIGVATGCDDVYITEDAERVESDRLLPLLLARDTATGIATWSGHYLINPWNHDGLVDLASYPRLRVYLEASEERLRERHVAKRRPNAWYRTIDRVDPLLQEKDKLVMPDIKAHSNPVLDLGDTYPHHNLYFVVSGAWDLEVLGGLLLSDVANALIGAYCVKMRGGTYRFQAQYIRRMRVPKPQSIDHVLQRALATAFQHHDREAATEAAAAVFGIERTMVEAALRS